MVKFFSILSLGLIFFSTPIIAKGNVASTAQSSIAAIINNDTILVSELNARIKLFLLSAGMDENVENRKQVAEQMLNRMIDEKLKLQLAKKFDLVATKEEIDDGFANVAARNNMNPAQLEEFLKSKRIPKSLLIDHIKADIVWHTYIKERHQSTIQINDQDVKSKIAEYKSNKMAEQAQLAEIVLFYNKGDANEKSTTANYAQKLINEIKRGANFAMVAQQSSHSASAALGGDIGWVMVSNLDAESKKAVDKMHPGDLSIVQMQNGIRILILRNKSVGGEANKVDTMLSFSQVIMPLPASPTMEALESLYQQTSSVSKNAKSTDGLAKLARSANEAAIVKMNNDVPSSNLNPQLRDILMKMPLNKASDPIRVEDGFLVFMVSKRQKVSPTDPTEDDIFRNILEQKLGQLSQRELRGLRRVAFIDLRV